jgi:hypothetical protein
MRHPHGLRAAAAAAGGGGDADIAVAHATSPFHKCLPVVIRFRYEICKSCDIACWRWTIMG